MRDSGLVDRRRAVRRFAREPEAVGERAQERRIILREVRVAQIGGCAAQLRQALVQNASPEQRRAWKPRP